MTGAGGHRRSRRGRLRVLLIGAAVLALGPAAGAVPPATAPSPVVSAPVARALDDAAPALPQPVTYQPPMSPLRVLRGFSPPATRYGPGHLGVDLAGGLGAGARSAADGVVTFAGTVAGRGVVVVAHRDGIRTEYEPVTPDVHVGDAVVAGQQLGVISGLHPGCVQECLHWGARRGDTYVDPLSLLQPLGVVRLLPNLGGS